MSGSFVPQAYESDAPSASSLVEASSSVSAGFRTVQVTVEGLPPKSHGALGLVALLIKSTRLGEASSDPDVVSNQTGYGLSVLWVLS